jgi:hypothetical protein
MANALGKSGLYFDELSKIRVLEPEVAQETNELKEECKDFVESKYRKFRVSLLQFLSPATLTIGRIVRHAGKVLIRTSHKFAGYMKFICAV